MLTDQRSTRRQILSRREVLKALGAIGGAAAASALLPEKWVKPVVEAGVLPAHAQTSTGPVSCYILDLTHRQVWVPAAGEFRVEVIGTISPAIAKLPLRIIFENYRPFHSSNRVFLYVETKLTDSEGQVNSGPMILTTQAGDGVVVNLGVMEGIGFCGREYLIP